jgi:hypothetical protein
VASSVLAIGELSRRVRLFVGDSGAAAATLGLDCVLKRSLILFSECFRFSALGLADIGRVWLNAAAELCMLSRGDVGLR